MPDENKEEMVSIPRSLFTALMEALVGSETVPAQMEESAEAQKAYDALMGERAAAREADLDVRSGAAALEYGDVETTIDDLLGAELEARRADDAVSLAGHLGIVPAALLEVHEAGGGRQSVDGLVDDAKRRAGARGDSVDVTAASVGALELVAAVDRQPLTLLKGVQDIRIKQVHGRTVFDVCSRNG